MEQIFKYPRTRHLEGSKQQIGDGDLNFVKLDDIKGKYLVLEEKVDGANCGISFGSDGKMYLQSRGHFLNGGYGERQFDLFKLWASCFESQLHRLLGDQYIMYGEWLYAKHTVFYDKLPHYFMEFDIFDKKKQRFYSTQKRKEILNNAPFIHSVRVLTDGTFETIDAIEKWVGPSLFTSDKQKQNFLTQCQKSGIDSTLAIRQTDLTGIMEGIYIKVEDGDYVTDRLKFVRRTFLNTILDSESHWVNRPIITNCLVNGVNLYTMPEEENH